MSWFCTAVAALMPRSVQSAVVSGRRVLIRVDLNVPMRAGQLTDATRLRAVVATVAALTARGARVILLSHFGRPEGRRAPELSLAPLATVLAEALGCDVAFVPECIGPVAEQAAAALSDGQVLLLENLRFHREEKANDPDFAAALARLGDMYVNDAFAAVHRTHASIVALAALLPAYAGPTLLAEIAALEAALTHPTRLVGAVVGGAKVSTKLEALNHLVTRVDWLALGGGMANTFLYALGQPVGRSLCEPDMATTARAVLARADTAGCAVILPSDVVTAPRLAADAPDTTRPIAAVPDDAMILDLGPASAAALAARIGECRTLVWNGPLGAFETPPFDAATIRIARAIAAATRAGQLFSVAGGGDTLAALASAGVDASADVSYRSTGGGAFLAWLEGRELPGVEALRRATEIGR